MDVLVLGGTRFVGTLTAWRLVAAGHAVTLLNRGTRADPFGERVERLRVDRTSPGWTATLAGRRFDATIDFAAYEGADVAAIVRELGARAGHYVFISSGQVYLVRDGCPRPAREADYDGPLVERPGDAGDAAEWDYGIGKRACEDALVRAGADGFRFTALRLPMVHGERDYHRRLDRYLVRLLDGGPLLVPDGGTTPMRHVYGGAIARAIVDLLGRPEAIGRSFNLAQRETPTLAELLGLLAAALGARPELVALPRRTIALAGLDVAALSPLSGRWISFVDPALAERELGFDHEPLATYLGHIVASYLAAPPPPPDDYGQRAAELALASRAPAPT